MSRLSKLWAKAKKGALRSVPLLLTGAIALIASPSFQHYVEHHPAVSAFVPAVVWLLHAAVHKPSP